jgi:hypothetical protein
MVAPIVPAALAARGKGRLSVAVRPWAIVRVDGKRLQQTPVRDVELPAGAHVITLEGSDRSETLHVIIEPRKTESITRDWTMPADALTGQRP